MAKAYTDGTATHATNGSQPEVKTTDSAAKPHGKD